MLRHKCGKVAMRTRVSLFARLTRRINFWEIQQRQRQHRGSRWRLLRRQVWRRSFVKVIVPFLKHRLCVHQRLLSTITDRILETSPHFCTLFSQSKFIIELSSNTRTKSFDTYYLPQKMPGFSGQTF